MAGPHRRYRGIFGPQLQGADAPSARTPVTYSSYRPVPALGDIASLGAISRVWFVAAKRKLDQLGVGEAFENLFSLISFDVEQSASPGENHAFAFLCPRGEPFCSAFRTRSVSLWNRRQARCNHP